MAERQTVFGFFDNMAEAQQAVQCLLANGFTHETVALSTPTAPNLTAVELAGSSGRFFSSLFGNSPDDQPVVARPNVARPDVEVNRRVGTLVAVKIKSASEASQVAELLDMAGAGDVAVEDNG